jgi:hypothetical protein
MNDAHSTSFESNEFVEDTIISHRNKISPRHKHWYAEMDMRVSIMPKNEEG